MMKDARKKLLQLLHKQELTTDDKRWLLDYLENTDQKELLQVLDAEFNNDINNPNQTDVNFPEELLIEIHRRAGIQYQEKPKVVLMWVSRLAVAASVIGVFLAASFWFLKSKEDVNQKQRVTVARVAKNDVAPGGNKAVLTLGNGKTIVLDSAKNGLIASQGSSSIVKTNNGELVYNATPQNKQEVAFNTISTPRGGSYQVVLPDGSQAWLNAASSIRFPTSFTGKERQVEITGEAYFEVTKNKAMPFIVKSARTEITVLGTHFNVNDYADEAYAKTTLLEGAVRISGKHATGTLKPGDQASLNENDEMKITANVNTEEAVAWKNGVFEFNRADISIMMRQIARWYDINIIYTGKTADALYKGKISRNVNLSEVLTMIKYMGINYTLNGKNLTIKD